MDDLISRQAAIDALDVLCQEHRYKIPGKRETYSQYNEAWQDALDRAEGAIFNLPSAQPNLQPTCNKLETDCISRQGVIDVLSQYPFEKVVNCISIIEEFPSAQPEEHTKERTETHGVCLDAIGRRDAIGALWKNRNLVFHDSADFDGTLFDITNLPSAQTKIIRCTECKWYEGDIMANPWGVCCHPSWVDGNSGHEVAERGWCYRAERREG